MGNNNSKEVNRKFRGILGALIGGIIGCVGLFLCEMSKGGVVFAGFLIGLLVLKMYESFSGGRSSIQLIIGAEVILVATGVSYVVYKILEFSNTRDAIWYGYTLRDCFLRLPILLRGSVLYTADYYKGLVKIFLSVGFGATGAYTSYGLTNSHNIKTVDRVKACEVFCIVFFFIFVVVGICKFFFVSRSKWQK